MFSCGRNVCFHCDCILSQRRDRLTLRRVSSHSLLQVVNFCIAKPHLSPYEETARALLQQLDDARKMEERLKEHGLQV